MKFLIGKDLQKALSSGNRVYLCGDGKESQEIPEIPDDNLEMGINHYDQFTAIPPHYHLRATEYKYVLQGSCKVWMVEEQKEYVMEAASFFVIPPMTPFAWKHAPGTRILFVKNPASYDRREVEPDETVREWMKEW